MQGGSCILIWGHFGSMCHLFQTTKNTDINIEEEEEDSQSYSCVQATSSHSWGVTKNHNGKFFEHHHINITSLWHPPIAAILQLWQWRPQGLPTGHQSDPKDRIVHHGVGVLQSVRYPDLSIIFSSENWLPNGPQWKTSHITMRGSQANIWQSREGWETYYAVPWAYNKVNSVSGGSSKKSRQNDAKASFASFFHISNWQIYQ